MADRNVRNPAFVSRYHFRPTGQVWLRSYGWSFIYADEIIKEKRKNIAVKYKGLTFGGHNNNTNNNHCAEKYRSTDFRTDGRSKYPKSGHCTGCRSRTVTALRRNPVVPGATRLAINDDLRSPMTARDWPSFFSTSEAQRNGAQRHNNCCNTSCLRVAVPRISQCLLDRSPPSLSSHRKYVCTAAARQTS